MCFKKTIAKGKIFFLLFLLYMFGIKYVASKQTQARKFSYKWSCLIKKSDFLTFNGISAFLS